MYRKDKNQTLSPFTVSLRKYVQESGGRQALADNLLLSMSAINKILVEVYAPSARVRRDLERLIGWNAEAQEVHS